jgi:hypothetical protein
LHPHRPRIISKDTATSLESYRRLRHAYVSAARILLRIPLCLHAHLIGRQSAHLCSHPSRSPLSPPLNGLEWGATDVLNGLDCSRRRCLRCLASGPGWSMPPLLRPAARVFNLMACLPSRHPSDALCLWFSTCLDTVHCLILTQ